MKVNYKTLRHSYYACIFLLVAYALLGIAFVREWLYPVFELELIPGMPIITLIALLTGVGAFAAYRYRKIG